MTPRIIARQLSHPGGVLGRLIVRLMNRHNAGINSYTLQRLEAAPSDRILEIGFGGGAMLEELIAEAGFVAGLDRSGYAVDRARRRFAAAVQNGRAEFREGSVESIPFDTGAFTKSCTVNTVYFWNSLDAGFAEIRRVLAPGGRVLVGFLPADRMQRLGVPGDIFTLCTADEITQSLMRTGFVDIHIEKPRPTTAWNVVVGTAGCNSNR